MAWTALHRALGETDTAVTLDLIRKAIDERLPEQADIDWKQKLPIGSGIPQSDDAELELAKDAAAMANSGGGIIVYGVKERDGRAHQLASPGDLSEGTQRRLRAILAARIQPPLMGVDVVVVTGNDESTPDNPDAEVGALVLIIPDSPDAPHLVFSKTVRDAFTAPWRDGPETRYLNERDLAAAYRRREQARLDTQHGFDQLVAHFEDDLLRSPEGAWIVCAAHPLTPLRNQRMLDDEHVRDDYTAQLSVPAHTRLSPLAETLGESWRAGLRSYRRTSTRTVTRNGRPMGTIYARVQIYHDGSVITAFNRGTVFDVPNVSFPRAVAAPDIEACAIDMFTMLWHLRLALGVRGNYLTRISITPHTDILLRPQSRYGDHLTWDGERRILRPITSGIVTTVGLTEAVNSWHDTVQDALHQAGCPLTADFDDRLHAGLP